MVNSFIEKNNIGKGVRSAVGKGGYTEKVNILNKTARTQERSKACGHLRNTFQIK